MTARVLILTGMSGAGRSSALKSLEDCGFDAVDNLPFRLLRSLLRAGEPLPASLAVGLDSRTRGLVPEELVAEIAVLRDRGDAAVTLLFMECEDEVLRRRFTETRRRHPLAADRPVSDGIARERRLLAPLKEAADLVIDTSATSTTDLRRWVLANFGPTPSQGLALALVSFAFRHGLPREADIVFDGRFLRNPHYVDELRPMTGLDREVQEYISMDPGFAPALQRLTDLVLPLLPAYVAEGKSYLTIAIGCTGGQHRSVFMAETLRDSLHDHGWPAKVIHRDMPREGLPRSGRDRQGSPEVA